MLPTSTPSNKNLAAALRYAELGYPVLACQPGGEKLLDNRPATTDPAAIRSWWADEPKANVAILPPAGCFALVVDPQHPGDGNLSKLSNEYGMLYMGTPRQCCGTRILRTDGRPITPGVLAEGVTVKIAEPVVVEPSKTDRGDLINWRPGKAPWEVEPVTPPPAWLDLITPPEQAEQPSAPAKPASSPTAPPTLEPRDPIADAKANKPVMMTDIGNAERFVAHFGQDVRYVVGLGWHTWTRRRWEADPEAIRVRRKAHRVARSIYKEAAVCPDSGAAEKLGKWAAKSESRDKIAAMLHEAQSLDGIAIEADALNHDPMLLNVRNGTVDLRTGKLRPHDRGDLITKLCNASINPTAKAERFEQFLNRIFRTHPDLIEYVQALIGYAATGLVNEQVLAFLWGSGSNGKTTLIDAVMHALGDYAGKADPELLMQQRNAHPTGMADLHGMRLAVCSETNEGRRFDEARLKDLTGESVIKARLMRQNFFSFKASHTLFLYSNHKPEVDGTNHGFWRRIRLVPFIEKIDGQEKDRTLGDQLKAEADGILAWIVAGAVAWFQHGLRTPEAVKVATREYRDEQDALGQFLGEACIIMDGQKELAGQLYSNYLLWCKTAGEQPLTQTKFGKQLGERGFKKDRCSTSGRSIWRGVTLRRNPSHGSKTPNPEQSEQFE